MKTTILLGAGSSLPAAYPSTHELTKLVVSGETVRRNSDGSYSTGSQELPDEMTRFASGMVRRLCAVVEQYYMERARRPPNYEDFYYLARQAFDEEAGELENPAIRSFSNFLAAETAQLVIPTDMEWIVALDETCNYVSDIVWSKLCGRAASMDHLQIFARAYESRLVTSISTLCHDTHVEKYLAGQGILVADGFSEPRNGVRYWKEVDPNRWTGWQLI